MGLFLVEGRLILLLAHPRPLSARRLCPRRLSWGTGSMPFAFQSDLVLGTQPEIHLRGAEEGGVRYVLRTPASP